MTRHGRVLTRLAVPLFRSSIASSLVLAALLACDASDEPQRVTNPPASFAQEFLDAHNEVRASATPVPDPALPPLAWSDDAAAVAQAWADRCEFAHNPARGARGENLYASAPAGATTPRDVVVGDPAADFDGWATESADFDHASNACADDKVCGHYTQLVWRDTLRVGCAKATCFGPAPFPWSGAWELWVCDYEPPGNVLDARPY
jgi:pathogenesis-related protein 1